MTSHMRVVLAILSLVLATASCFMSGAALIMIVSHLRSEPRGADHWTRTDMQLWTSDLQGRNPDLKLPNDSQPLPSLVRGQPEP